MGRLMIYFMNSQDERTLTYSLKLLVRRAAEATLAYESFCNDCNLSVTFTDNEGIRRINAEYRKRCRLCISQEPLGDIVLSLERAEEQAEEFGHSFEREVAFLTVHSMLHLLGYDHVNSEEEDEEMRRRQREILARMGLGLAT